MKQLPMAALLAVSLCLTDANAAEPRSVSELLVQSIDRTGRSPLAEPAPLLISGYQVLLVLDPSRSNSLAVLGMFEHSEHDGHGLVLLALGENDPEHLQSALAESIPEARWMQGDLGHTLAQLDLPGTPLLLGIDPEGAVRWMRAGVPERIETWDAAIRAWTARVRVDPRQESAQ